MAWSPILYTKMCQGVGSSGGGGGLGSCFSGGVGVVGIGGSWVGFREVGIRVVGVMGVGVGGIRGWG